MIWLLPRIWVGVKKVFGFIIGQKRPGSEQRKHSRAADQIRPTIKNRLFAIDCQATYNRV